MREETKKKDGKSFTANTVKGSLVGVCVCLLMLVIFSILIAGGKISSSLMEYIAIGTLFIGSFIGGATTIKKQKGRVLLAGLAEGGVLFLITIVIGAFMPGATIGNATLTLMIASLIGGAMAGLIFSKPKKVKI